MKLGQLANIAVEILTGRSEEESAAKMLGTTRKHVTSIKENLKKKAYTTFGPLPLDLTVSSVAAGRKINVVQIGANDGLSGDPIHHLVRAHAAKAVLVEPQPELVEKIKKNYTGFSGDLAIERVAIGPEAGTMHLYRLKQNHHEQYIKNVGRHPSEIVSFNKGYVVEKIAPRMKVDSAAAEAMLEALECPVLPVHELARRNGIENIDLLQIDCEGYDVEVILSLGDIRPQIINFESMNLSKDAWSKWMKWSAVNGYGFIQGPQDTLAILGANFRLEY